MNKFYNTDTVPSFGRFRFGLILGILLFIIGLAALVFSIIDLFHGRPSVYHYDDTQAGLKIEDPLWPSSGKGFWVGLVLMATGVVGILASRERTRSAIIAFTLLATVSTVLSFYLMITCIIPVQYDVQNSNSNNRPRWQSNELILNSLLIAAGVLGSIVGAVASVIGCIFAGFCSDQRDMPKVNRDPYGYANMRPSAPPRMSGSSFNTPRNPGPPGFPRL